MPNADNTGPGYPEGYQYVSTGYEYDILIDQRVSTGFPKWGFVIVRGTYDNDAEWNTFIALLKESVARSLQFAKQEDKLRPDLEWTVIEDRASLEGASKDTVRAHFLEWVAARSVERDGVQADAPWLADYIPRYQYCIYVDDACFGSICAERVGRTTQWSLGDGKVAIINGLHWPNNNDDDDGNNDHDGDGEESEEDEVVDEYISVEGNSAYDVGWAYIDAAELGSIYTHMCHAGAWDTFYRGRRPDQHPEPCQGHSLSAVDRVWVAGSSLAPEY